VSGPDPLIDRITERRRLGQGWTSRLLQSVLLDLLTRADTIAQVDAARRVYAQRRADLVGALASHGVEVAARDGINIWLPVLDETAALLRLAAARIGAAAGRPFAARPDEHAYLRITGGLIDTGLAGIAGQLAAASRLRAWREPH
jgi:DNA-binding transcriptional MocR family regulator